MTENMEIWDAVSKTDPDHTKRVNQRGGFTAIDAQYQFMNATAQFGPVGRGWGFEVKRVEVHPPFVMVHVSLWHGDRANEFGPLIGCAEMLGNRPDSDAPKKATTDAITKGLSMLGFNADVFLGKFDDSKYVNDLRAEKAQSSKVVDLEAEKHAADEKASKAKAFAAEFAAIIENAVDDLSATQAIANNAASVARAWAYKDARDLIDAACARRGIGVEIRDKKAVAHVAEDPARNVGAG